ncbi:MAG: M48 family metalloprotease [Burkholderiales bacterium]|nr:M48 family metalloprotease [Burkholderiales bacterium]
MSLLQMQWRQLWLAPLFILAACSTPPAAPPKPAPVQAEPANTTTAAPQSTQAVEALRTLVAMQDKLDRVAAPLLLKNAELCKTQARNLLGFTAKNRYSYSSEYNDAAHELFALEEKLQVIGVLQGSGAALAGVKRGDTLMSIEDKDLPQGQNAERLAATILAPLVARKTSVKMAIQRNGENMSVTVPLTRACGFRVELGNADNVATYADGQRVMITRGMLTFTKSDEELAYLIAKEMAHNALSHPAKNRSNTRMAAMMDNLIQVNPDLSLLITGGGIKAYPAEMDAAADNLALYMLARAGYLLDNAKPFWQRLANQYPATMLSSYSALHPNTAARMVAIDKAVSDIKAKQAAKKVLVP